VQPTMYQICIRGRVTERIGSALEGMRLEAGTTETVFTGEIRDQSQLYGLLDRVRDLGLELVSVQPQPAADPTTTTPHQEGPVMQAITVSDRDAGVAGLSLTDLPYPQAADNDVVVRVHAAGFTPGELDWPHTWIDRAGRDRTPSVPGHELSGVVVELGYGTTLLSVGQRVFGLADWARDGSLAEYTAVEARNLAPLPMDIDHTVAAALPISGLAAWQGLFDHGRLAAGQTVLIHGAAGGVGSIAVQLAREVGARVIGTGRTADRDRAGELGVHTFLDLETEKLEDAGEVDVVFDVIGGEVLARSAALVRAGGTLVTIAEPPKTQPRDGRAVFFLVEADRAQLADLASRVRDGRLKPVVGAVLPLAEAAAAFAPGKRIPGKTILRVAED
jgi:NADPH:quinone reductase-like Zn-dependent oxidoreductase